MHSSKSSIIILSYNLRLLKIELSILFPLIKKAFDFNLNLEWNNSDGTSVTQIIDSLSSVCEQIAFIRLNKVRDQNSLSLQVNLYHNNNVETLEKKLTELNNKISIQIYNSAIE